MLATLLTRIGFAKSDAVEAYAGLDSQPEDSGTKRGRRLLSKKRSPLLRRQVVLVGVAASHSKALKQLYQSIRAKGFSSMQALVILGSQVLHVVFAAWKGYQV